MLLHLAGYGLCPLEQVVNVDQNFGEGFPDVFRFNVFIIFFFVIEGRGIIILGGDLLFWSEMDEIFWSFL